MGHSALSWVASEPYRQVMLRPVDACTIPSWPDDACIGGGREDFVEDGLGAFVEGSYQIPGGWRNWSDGWSTSSAEHPS
jgi:hypothetical protein